MGERNGCQALNNSNGRSELTENCDKLDSSRYLSFQRIENKTVDQISCVPNPGLETQRKHEQSFSKNNAELLETNQNRDLSNLSNSAKKIRQSIEEEKDSGRSEQIENKALMCGGKKLPNTDNYEHTSFQDETLTKETFVSEDYDDESIYMSSDSEAKLSKDLSAFEKQKENDDYTMINKSADNQRKCIESANDEMSNSSPNDSFDVLELIDSDPEEPSSKIGTESHTMGTIKLELVLSESEGSSASEDFRDDSFNIEEELYEEPSYELISAVSDNKDLRTSAKLNQDEIIKEDASERKASILLKELDRVELVADNIINESIDLGIDCEIESDKEE